MRQLAMMLALMLAIPLASGIIQVDLDIKPNFNVGEQVGFDYTILSDEDTQVFYLLHIDCPSAPMAPMLERSALLEAGEVRRGTYTDQVIDSSFEPQECVAYIELMAPQRTTVSNSFSIMVEPSFDFHVEVCKDSDCLTPSKFFEWDEQAYLSYESELQGLSIEATLRFPNQSIMTISLPSSMELIVPGTYTLEATATKQGYKTINSNIQFSLISAPPTMNHGSVCNADGVCSEGEDEQSCPQDCATKQAGWVIVFPILAVVMMIAIALWLYRKK